MNGSAAFVLSSINFIVRSQLSTQDKYKQPKEKKSVKKTRKKKNNGKFKKVGSGKEIQQKNS